MTVRTVPRVTEHHERPAAPARRWVGRIRRARYFSPLALALALMMSAASWAPLASPRLVPAAEAQGIEIGSCAPSANRIIQEICNESGGPLAVLPALQRFESAIIDAFMQVHQLPPEDRPLVLKYARTGVRSAMLVKLIAIAHTAATDRTPDEQAVLDWFQARVWQNEKDMIQAAIDEYNRWRADPCLYTLDPDIAQAQNLTYSGAPFCHPDPFSLGPEAPDKAYFLALGFQDAYNKPVADTPGGPAITAGTIRGIALFASAPVIALAVVAAITIGGPILVTTGVAAAIFPFAASASLGVFAAGVAASVVFFVLIALVVGIVAAIKVFSPTALDELNSLKASIHAAAPNLALFTDGAGVLKLTQTLVQETLPEFTSPDPFPAHRDEDGLFVIQSGGGSGSPNLTLTYRGWDGDARTATLVHGFFVVEHTLDDASVERDMTLSIDYVDWSGRPWTAWRRGDTFVSVKGAALPTFTDADVAGATIDLLNGSGAPVRVSIGHPPVITSASSTAFSIGAANSFTITTTGTTPAITLATGALPSGVTFADRLDGTATLSGTPAAGTAGSYPLTLVAKNAAGETSQSFRLFAGTAPVFSSVPPLVLREGRAASITIVATGAPAPSIRLDHLIQCDLSTGQCAPGGGPALPGGVTFTDVGDGTATITGTPAAGTGSLLFITHFLSASNANGTVSQTVDLGVKPPLAITSASNATFAIGTSGTFTIRTTGGPLNLAATGALPANVSFTDNGDGTATLAGTPVAGTRGAYPLTVKATADDGSVTQSFTLAVESRLTVLGPATAWIGVTNSDNVGLRVDLLAEVFLKVSGMATKVGEGQLANQATGSSGFNNALLKTITVALMGEPISVPAGAELQYKLSVRRTCSGTGHNSGTAAFWYNGRLVDGGAMRDAGSRVATTVGAVAGNFFMHPGLGLTGTAGTARTSVTAALTSAQPCPSRPYTPFGTWFGPLP